MGFEEEAAEGSEVEEIPVDVQETEDAIKLGIFTLHDAEKKGRGRYRKSSKCSSALRMAVCDKIACLI